MASDPRELSDLISAGPAMLRDFEILGVRSVAQLARRNPERLYESLCAAAPQHQDICCLDVFRAAVAQACDPKLPVEQCQWWYWSRDRKRREKNARTRYK
jgi:Pathogenicity locus